MKENPKKTKERLWEKVLRKSFKEPSLFVKPPASLEEFQTNERFAPFRKNSGGKKAVRKAVAH